MAAAPSSIRNELADVVECSICCEIYKDPRSLPCVHSFCLECIEGFSRGKNPGDRVECPLCRNEFKIPRNGVIGLPKNFFIEKMKRVRELAGSRAIQDQSSMCSRHPKNPLTLYCTDDKLVLCTKCIAESHKAHKWIDISDVSEELRQQLKGNIGRQEVSVRKCDDIRKGLLEEKEQFISRYQVVQRQISERAELLKQEVERQKQDLLSELNDVKTESVMQVDHIIQEVEQRRSMLSSLKQYTEELLKNGSDVDVGQETNKLSERTSELSKFDEHERAIEELGSVEVSFVLPRQPQETGRESSNRIGRIEVNKLKGINTDHSTCCLNCSC